jgi:hypothetical protein
MEKRTNTEGPSNIGNLFVSTSFWFWISIGLLVGFIAICAIFAIRLYRDARKHMSGVGSARSVRPSAPKQKETKKQKKEVPSPLNRFQNYYSSQEESAAMYSNQVNITTLPHSTSICLATRDARSIEF